MTEGQIIGILPEHKGGVQTADVCGKHGSSQNTFYNRRSEYDVLDVSDARRLKSLKTENARLKRLLANAMLDNAALKDRLGKG